MIVEIAASNILTLFGHINIILMGNYSSGIQKFNTFQRFRKFPPQKEVQIYVFAVTIPSNFSNNSVYVDHILPYLLS